MAVNENGKYTKLTEDTVKKLEEAFAMDCPVVEASLYANITTQTYYNWIKKNPEMEERFDELRNRPFLQARRTIIKSINEDPHYAFEYMKRKKRKEFGDAIDLTTENKPIVNNENVEKFSTTIKEFEERLRKDYLEKK